jgi:hypothetical protein
MKESSEGLRDALHPIFNQSLLSISVVVFSRGLSVLEKGGDRLRDFRGSLFIFGRGCFNS